MAYLSCEPDPYWRDEVEPPATVTVRVTGWEQKEIMAEKTCFCNLENIFISFSSAFT